MSTTPIQASTVSLKRNIVYAIVSRVFLALAQFIVLAIIVRLGTQEDVGALTLASAIVTPLFFLTSMGMNEVHVVDDLKRFSRADYVALRLLGGFAAILMTVLIVLMFEQSRSGIVQASAIAFAFLRFFAAQSGLNQGVFQRAERLDYVFVSTVVRGTIGLITFGTAFYFTRNLPMSMAIEAVAWFFSYFVIDRTLLGRINAKTQFSQLREVKVKTVFALARWVLPVGIALWMIRASNSVPPMVLARYEGLAAVGLFGTLVYAHSAISMALGPMGVASAARLRRYYIGGDRRAFTSLTLNLALTAAVMGGIGVVVSWFAGDFVLKHLFGEAYRDAVLLTIIVFGTALSIIAMQLLVAVTAAQAFNHRLISGAVGLVAALISSPILISQDGVHGAGWAMVVMAAARLAYSIYAVRRVIHTMPAPMAAAAEVVAR